MVGILGVFVVVAVMLSGGSIDTDAGQAVDGALAAAGEPLYAANCATCHGPDLRGTATGPPFLDAIYAPNHHGDEAFQRAVALGVVSHHWNFGPMAPVAGLTRDDVAKIVAFVRSQQQAADIMRDPSQP